MRSNSLVDCDLCVIGGGPAGIICVLEYTRLNPGKSVVLIEYGYPCQKKVNGLDNTIQIMNLTNHFGPYECTNKGLGGTSSTWGGRCVMYDEIDFLSRPSINNNCTWDKKLFDEVKCFSSKAASYFECGEALFSTNEMPELLNTRIAENFKEGCVTDNIVERWSMPTRFGKKYKKELAERHNLTIMEGCEARVFGMPDEKGNVQNLIFRDIRNGEISTITAKNFILAAGAQETTRILLRNTRLFRLLNFIPPALGRYYQSHLSGKLASISFSGNPKKTEYGFLRSRDGTYLRRRLQFTTEFLLQNNLLNTAIWLDNPLYWDAKHGNGAMSLMYLAMKLPFMGKKLAPPAIAYSITKEEPINFPEHFNNILKDLPKSLLIPGTIFCKRYLLKRKLPGVFLFNPKNIYAINFHSEQIPSYENRMVLADDGEQLIIHYELSESDICSVIKIHEKLDAWLRDCNCGKLEYWYNKMELPKAIKKISKDGIHQIGTTRIGNTPKIGVVDRNLRLWGTENIFVCSSSVFPTSSQANPTFFLGSFAVRLANYLTMTK